jgi:uncharacterized protein YjbI with pentapeptide repeats
MGCLIFTSVFGFDLWIDELNFALIAITSILLNQTVVILYKNLNDALSKRMILPYRTVENPLSIDEANWTGADLAGADLAGAGEYKNGNAIEINIH